jgi:tRNA pseudouridine55 synthase
MTLFGLLNLNKPSGVTSRRVVDLVQRLVKPAKVGHAGTLDPLASGVLVLGMGQATRLVEYVHEMPKRYLATFLLGRTSTTEDIEGEVTFLPNAAPAALEDLQRAAAELTGDIDQRPPAFSALKVAGRRAYALARAGQPVELAPRRIHIERLQVLRYDYPELQLDITCSSGTYVRSLGRDLAELAGTGAVMSALVRTAVGRFTLDDAIDPTDLTLDKIVASLQPALHAVEHLMSVCAVSDDQVARLANGLPIELDLVGDARRAAVDPKGVLVAILERRDARAFASSKFFPATA